jgi:hypothetical protein
VADDVAEAPEPAFTSEDFSFMLQERPGAYIWLGQKAPEHDQPLHHPRYDFNDGVIASGVALFTALVRRELPDPDRWAVTAYPAHPPPSFSRKRPLAPPQCNLIP